jgi:hypothetical protein
MLTKMSRRAILTGGLGAGALAPAFGSIGAAPGAAALIPLSESDLTAKALGFVSDATAVNAGEYRTYEAGQHCFTCVQFRGKAGDAAGGCSIFAGHSVPAAGWCAVQAAKPG